MGEGVAAEGAGAVCAPVVPVCVEVPELDEAIAEPDGF